MQLYVEDFLAALISQGIKAKTKTLFQDQNSFKEEIRRIFREVDVKNQAKKAIMRLKQTASVTAYTAKFKQLQARIDQDNAAL